MALSASVQWDVRTTGDDSNAGGFDIGPGTGTDYSQQNSAQVTIDNATVVATVTGSTITFVSGYTPSANDVNNVVNLISSTGGTPPTFSRYTIASQTSSTWVLDRSTGAAGATLTSAKMGGSLATVAKLFAVYTVDLQRGWVKTGTYNQTSTLTTPNLAVLTEGYQSTHSDLGTPPLITTATNSTDLVDVASGGGSYRLAVFRNISFSNTAGTPANGLVKTSTNGAVSLEKCTFSGFTTALNGDNAGAHFVFTPLILSDCEIASSTSHAIVNQLDVVISTSYIHHSGGRGVNLTGTGNVFVSHSVLYANDYGIFQGSGPYVYLLNSAIVNSTHDGVLLSQVNSMCGAYGAIFYGNGGYAVNQTNVGGPWYPIFYANNAYGSNGSPGWHNITLTNTGSDATLTADPFTNSAAGDFTLNSTPGGGAACKGAGFPGITPAGTAYQDLGALQSNGGGGSSAVVIVNRIVNQFLVEEGGYH